MTAATAVPVEVLTDEELEVLQADSPFVVRPHLTALAEGDRLASLRTAYRGLIARDVLDPPTPESLAASGAAPTVTVQVREDVRSLVELRRAAPAVLCVARTTSAGQDFWYAHVAAQVVLIEQVSTDGFHRFALADADALGDLLLAASTHPDSVDGTGPAVRLTDIAAPPPEVLDRLGSAHLRADVVLRAAGEEHPVLAGLFTGPGGCWLLTVTLASNDPPLLRPVSRTDLTTHVRDLTATTRAAALPDPGAQP
ncbi:MAG TPA: hypothetical protein VGC67_07200 [Cellulomonas sp.]